MKIIALGLSHKTAPIEVREKFFCNEVQQELLLSELKNHCEIVEALVLSTCNRTEVYARVLHGAEDFGVIFKKLSDIKKLKSLQKYQKHFYFLEGEQVVRHLLKVAAGLDSLVLGERQILGQLKEAISLSRKKGLLQKHFNILTNLAIRTGKKAQNETEISFGGRSISWAAVTKAEQIYGSLQGKKALIIGAGEMSTIAGDLLKSRGTSTIYVMNRTQEKAQELAGRCGGVPVGFLDIKNILSEVSLGICAVDAPHYILEKETVQHVASNRFENLLLIDISIPRNIDPLAGKVPGVQLIYMDDLEGVVVENRLRRENAISSVEMIVDVKFSSFYKKIQENDQVRELNSSPAT